MSESRDDAREPEDLGELALTYTRLPGGAEATAEVARRQPDGTWRWVLDRPNVT